MKKIAKFINGILLLILSVAAIIEIYRADWSAVFVICSSLVLSLIPLILDRWYEIRFSSGLRIGIVLFMFSTLFLGEVNHFYDEFFWWDTLLHFTAGFGLTIFGFIILKEIYAQSQLRSVPSMTSLFAFSFTCMMAVLWEIYEYLIDLFNISDGPMQPSNNDTMIDIIVALIAACIVCVFGYRHLRVNHKNFASEMIEDTDLKLKDKLK